MGYALARWRTFYRSEAPRAFREAHGEDPTPEALLAYLKLKGHVLSFEEEEALRIAQDLT